LAYQIQKELGVQSKECKKSRSIW